MVLGSRDLAAKTTASAKDFVVSCVNPGWYKTELFSHEDLGIERRFALRIMGRTGEEGSRTLVHASSADKLTHGKYLSECQVKPESQFVRSEVGQHVQERVANELRKALEQIQLARKGRLGL